MRSSVSNIDDADVVEQARLIQRGELDRRELVELTIRRIEQVNPRLNAVVQEMFQEGREVAATAPEGRFSGVPFLIKDIYLQYKGVPTTGASKITANFVPDHDSELMARYRRAGLVTIGKTNLCEFGTLGTTEPKLFGPTLNPWNTAHSSGGSSGGAGAAVAAGMVAAAHGGDGAGSIRIPASCCGVFGLKPSRGRITLGPDLGDSIGGIVNEHVLTRSVRDSAALLDATEGPLVGDPYTIERPSTSFLEQASRPPRILRIAVTTHSLIGTTVDEECAVAVEEAARLCESLGHRVEYASPAFDGNVYQKKYRLFWAMTATRSITVAAERMGRDRHKVAEDAEAFNQYLFGVGIRRLAADYINDLSWFHGVGRIFGRFFNDYDVWLTPTLGSPPPLLGHFDAAVVGCEEVMNRFMQFLAFTTFANMSGQPAMSVPLHWSKAMLPVGVQFTSAYGAEGLLLSLATQLENARPWRERKPPVAATCASS